VKIGKKNTKIRGKREEFKKGGGGTTWGKTTPTLTRRERFGLEKDGKSFTVPGEMKTADWWSLAAKKE